MRMRRITAIPLLALLAAAALAGCSGGPTGTVTGHLVRAGGPAPGAAVPLPGTVTATSGSSAFHATAGNDGSFTITVPAGSYRLTGSSFQVQDGKETCIAAGPAVVRAGATTTAVITCNIA